MATLQEHIRCWDCSYDLFGLDELGRCPECGFPIHRSVLAKERGNALNAEAIRADDAVAEHDRQMREGAIMAERYARQLDRSDQLHERNERLLAIQEENARRASDLLNRMADLLMKWEQK